MKPLNISKKNKIGYFIKSVFSLFIIAYAFIGSVPVQAQSDGTQQLWFSTSETENIATPLTEFNTPAIGEEFTLYVIYNDFNIGAGGVSRLEFNVHWNNSILEHSDPAEVTSAGMTAQAHPESDANTVISISEEDSPTPPVGAQSDGISDGDAETDYVVTPFFANVFGTIFPISPVALLRVKFRWRADATEGATNTALNLTFRSNPNFNAPNREPTNLVINAPSTNAPPIANAGDNQTVDEGAAVILDGSGSTDDDGITAYAWTANIPTLTLSGANTATVTFSAPVVEKAGLDIILTLTVTDARGLTDSATVLITVTPEITLDIDENGSIDSSDSIIILRYSFSIRGDGLTRGQTTTLPETVEVNIQNAINNLDLDVDESGFLSSEDFIMILRYILFNSRGNELISGQTATLPETVGNNIEALRP